MDREQNDALSRLVPFAQAVLALKDLSEAERRANRAVTEAQARLDQTRSAQQASEERTAVEQARLSEYQDQLFLVQASIDEGNRRIAEAIAKAKADAAQAYRTEYDSKTGELAQVDRQIADAKARLDELQAQIAEANAAHQAVQADLQNLRAKLG